MLQAIKQNWRNWTGISLALIHAIALTGLVLAKEPLPPPAPCPPNEICLDPWHTPYAGTFLTTGRLIHFAHENLPLQFLILADTPSNLVTTVVLAFLWWPMKILNFSELTISYVAGFLWLTIGSLQWWLIGTVAEIKLRQKWKPSDV